jgi:hypothetical protein
MQLLRKHAKPKSIAARSYHSMHHQVWLDRKRPVSPIEKAWCHNEAGYAYANWEILLSANIGGNCYAASFEGHRFTVSLLELGKCGHTLCKAAHHVSDAHRTVARILTI